MRLSNPGRTAQGGDVTGDTRIDVTMGEAIKVASASFDPGYYVTSLDRSLPLTKKADLVQGYCTYGRAVGEPGDGLEDWDKV